MDERPRDRARHAADLQNLPDPEPHVGSACAARRPGPVILSQVWGEREAPWRRRAEEEWARAGGCCARPRPRSPARAFSCLISLLRSLGAVCARPGPASVSVYRAALRTGGRLPLGSLRPWNALDRPTGAACRAHLLFGRRHVSVQSVRGKCADYVEEFTDDFSLINKFPFSNFL